jgi:hypothetical protein
MANTTVSIIIRYEKDGKRGQASAAYAGKARLKPASAATNAVRNLCARFSLTESPNRIPGLMPPPPSQPDLRQIVLHRPIECTAFIEQ